MTVMKAWIAGTSYENASTESDIANEAIKLLLVQGIATNSTAYIDKNKNPSKPEHIGSKTECALLDFCDKIPIQFNDTIRYNYHTVRKQHPIRKMYPFSSTKKTMTTLLEPEEGKCKLFTKGASEIILERCQYALNSRGEQIAIETVKEEVNGVINQ
jgi:Ca2+ transporting ATPase